MAKILFIDLEAHRATGSSSFFVDLLRRRFDVDVVYVSSRYSPEMPKSSQVSGYDCVVCWQVTPSNMRALSYGKPIVYVPMYDGETGNVVKWLRNRIQGIRTISFCRAESEILKKAGINPLVVAYYPPVGERVPGDLRKVFFWDRGDIAGDAVRRVFPGESGFEIVEWKRPLVAGEMSRDEYLSRVKECGVFVAPRRLEGIGLSFLEVMAMGKCVIANDAPTMNEYIDNGQNGVLVDVDEVANVGLKFSPEAAGSIQDKTYASSAEGRRIWESVDEPAILDFIDGAINEYRELTMVEAVKWWLLLPLHFIWDLKTLVEQIWKRVKS